MKNILIQATKDFAAKNKRAFDVESHFENGYGSKYILAKTGSFGLKAADARLGNRFAVVLHGERGTISVLSGYLTPLRLIGWMQATIINRTKPATT